MWWVHGVGETPTGKCISPLPRPAYVGRPAYFSCLRNSEWSVALTPPPPHIRVIRNKQDKSRRVGSRISLSGTPTAVDDGRCSRSHSAAPSSHITQPANSPHRSARPSPTVPSPRPDSPTQTTRMAAVAASNGEGKSSRAPPSACVPSGEIKPHSPPSQRTLRQQHRWAAASLRCLGWAPRCRLRERRQ